METAVVALERQEELGVGERAAVSAAQAPARAASPEMPAWRGGVARAGAPRGAVAGALGKVVTASRGAVARAAPLDVVVRAAEGLVASAATRGRAAPVDRPAATWASRAVQAPAARRA